MPHQIRGGSVIFLNNNTLEIKHIKEEKTVIMFAIALKPKVQGVKRMPIAIGIVL
jgi:hypothetical protein